MKQDKFSEEVPGWKAHGWLKAIRKCVITKEVDRAANNPNHVDQPRSATKWQYNEILHAMGSTPVIRRAKSSSRRGCGLQHSQTECLHTQVVLPSAQAVYPELDLQPSPPLK